MKTNSQPLVSVVTPVYNGAEYLAECIESVLAQTYENWEYVIANNFSTDSSLEIAQQYAQQDARIRVHNNKEFLNQKQNWNHALCQISAESKYCKVLHADDWLFPGCISRMVALAEANPTVGIVSSYRLVEARVELDGLPYPSTFMPGRDICRLNLLGGPRVFGSPTSLLIRSDIIRSRQDFYDESVIHADTEICFDILQDHDFGFVHEVLSFTRRHNESQTSLTHMFNTILLGRLSNFVKYGPIYLNDKEYKNHLNKVLNHYHLFLAESIFDLKGKEFWNYHRNELEKLGHSPSVTRFLKGLFLTSLNSINAAGRLRRAIQRKRQKTSQDTLQWDTVLSSVCSQEN